MTRSQSVIESDIATTKRAITDAKADLRKEVRRNRRYNERNQRDRSMSAREVAKEKKDGEDQEKLLQDGIDALERDLTNLEYELAHVYDNVSAAGYSGSGYASTYFSSENDTVFTRSRSPSPLPAPARPISPYGPSYGAPRGPIEQYYSYFEPTEEQRDAARRTYGGNY